MTANPKPDAVTADTSVKDYLNALEGNLQFVRRSLLSAADEITRLRAELAEAGESAQSAHAVGFAAGIEAAASAVQAYEVECAKFQSECGAIVNAFDSLTYASSAIRALTPPDITAAAARALLADDVALSKMAGAVHDGPLGADDYWFSAATPQGGWCVDVVRASLRALAEVKP